MDTVTDRNNATLLATALITIAALGVPGPARAQSCAHGDGHAEMHHVYKEWQDNRGFGCCDNRDCRPVRADLGPLGWRVWIDGRWVAVPPDTVLGIPSPNPRVTQAARASKAHRSDVQQQVKIWPVRGRECATTDLSR